MDFTGVNLMLPQGRVSGSDVGPALAGDGSYSMLGRTPLSGPAIRRGGPQVRADVLGNSAVVDRSPVDRKLCCPGFRRFTCFSGPTYRRGWAAIKAKRRNPRDEKQSAFMFHGPGPRIFRSRQGLFSHRAE